MKVGLTGSALRADRQADSACEVSIFLDATSFRPTARGDPSSGTLESCAHSKSGVCALPTCVENPVSVIAKKARAISSHTRICVSSRDWCRYGSLFETPNYPSILALSSCVVEEKTVQPVLAKFYNSLSDEEKARFNSLRSASRPTG